MASAGSTRSRDPAAATALRAKLINEAQSEYNKVIPRARGEAQQVIQEAEGYLLERVNTARGDSARFVPFYEEYRKAPDVTRKRIYLETMGRILPQVQRKVVVDEDLRMRTVDDNRRAINQAFDDFDGGTKPPPA